MTSTLPVASPALTMCFIMGGKKAMAASTSETWPPWLTCLAISRQASSICTSLLAAEVISSVGRMGAPERGRAKGGRRATVAAGVVQGEVPGGGHAVLRGGCGAFY